MSWLIYKHTNLINGKCYIGQTKQNPNKRWNHGRGYSSNSKFTNAINKYGWNNFKHEIIEDNIPTLELTNEREQYYIKLYDSYYNGYNLTLGGDTNQTERMWTPEEDKIIKNTYNKDCEKTFKLLSSFDRTKPQIQQRASIIGVISSYIINREWTEEEIKKLKKLYSLYGVSCYTRFSGRSKSAIHKMATQLKLRHSNKIIWTEEEKEIVSNYYFERGLSIIELLPNKTKQQLICYVTKHKIRYNSNIWTDEEINILKENYSIMGLKIVELLPNRSEQSILQKANELNLKSVARNRKKVLCVEKNKIFNSLVDAARFCNIKDSKSIGKVCNGKATRAGGYHWKYVE